MASSRWDDWQVQRFDARPGESYRMVLTYPDAFGARGKATADSDIVEARFVGIVPGEHLVQAVDFVSDDPANAGTMTMTWKVTAVEERTRVDIVAEDVPDGIPAADHAAGLASSLAKLAAYVEQSPAPPAVRGRSKRARPPRHTLKPNSTTSPSCET
jgi:uncharacterized protein YndB with AHSA1/START domain